MVHSDSSNKKIGNTILTILCIHNNQNLNNKNGKNNNDDNSNNNNNNNGNTNNNNSGSPITMIITIPLATITAQAYTHQ